MRVLCLVVVPDGVGLDLQLAHAGDVVKSPTLKGAVGQPVGDVRAIAAWSLQSTTRRLDVSFLSKPRIELGVGESGDDDLFGLLKVLGGLRHRGKTVESGQ